VPLPAPFLATLRRPRADVIDPLCAFLATYVKGDAAAEAQRRLTEVLREATDAEWTDYVDFLATFGADWGRHDAHPLGRAMTWALFDPLLHPDSTLSGLEHLDAVIDGRTMIVCNHLSYVDPTSLWALMRREGRQDLADRLTAVAGPKVYEGEPMRLMGASANHSIKVAQSAQVATEAGLGPRDIARITRASLQLAAELMDAGRIVLIYPEGTRSRTGRLGPFLPGVGRWLALDGVRIVPLALAGPNRLYGLDGDTLHPATVRGWLGAPVDTSAAASREDRVHLARNAVAALLPEDMR